MTLLVGIDSVVSPASNSPQSSGGDAFWDNAGHVAAASSSSTTMTFYWYCTNWDVSTGAKGSVYDNAGNLLGTSAAFAPADGTGLIGKSITLSSNIVSGNTYKLVIQSTGGFVEVRWDTSGSNTKAVVGSGSFNYASPPSSLPSPTTGAAFPWIVWLDGTTGGAVTVVPSASPQRNRRSSGRFL